MENQDFVFVEQGNKAIFGGNKELVPPWEGLKCLIFGRTLRLLPYSICANSDGSGETHESSLVAYVISIIIS